MSKGTILVQVIGGPLDGAEYTVDESLYELRFSCPPKDIVYLKPDQPMTEFGYSIKRLPIVKHKYRPNMYAVYWDEVK